MSAPQGGRPVLSTANRRGKHLQDKQSTHYLWEHWRCHTAKTHLYKNTTAATHGRLHSKTFGCKMPLPHSPHITILLANVLDWMFTHWSLFFILLECFQNRRYFVLEGNSLRIFIKNTKGPSSLGLGINPFYFGTIPKWCIIFHIRCIFFKFSMVSHWYKLQSKIHKALIVIRNHQMKD